MSDPASSRAACGHTLVELLAVLCILGVLTAGLMVFLAGTLRALGKAEASLEAQHSLRRALEELSDEIQGLGFRVPMRTGPPEGPVFSVKENQPVRTLGGRWSGGEDFRTDELVLLRDEILPGQSRLDEPFSAAVSAATRVTANRKTSLERGDVLVFEDGLWEGLTVASPCELPAGRCVEVRVAPLDGAGAPACHARGAPVAFIRPHRRVRYALAHSRKGGTLPSLMRFESSGGPGMQDGPGRIVARNITGFRVRLPWGPGAVLPPLVEITLEASPRAGTRRSMKLARVPRNARRAPG